MGVVAQVAFFFISLLMRFKDTDASFKLRFLFFEGDFNIS